MLKTKPDYAEIAARDKAAFALAERDGIGFSEAMLRVFDGEEVEQKISVNRTPQFGVSERAE